MSDIDIRREARDEMFGLLRKSPVSSLLFEIKIKIMQSEIMDDYLEEKIRSDKVLEGLLGDIYKAMRKS